MKYIMVIFLALGMAGCGNTITGIGKDITDVGEKVSKWQNDPVEEDVVVVEKDEDSGETE